jgi:peptide/nickel transport system permease protein
MAVAPAVKTKAPTRLQRWWRGISIIFDSRVATVGLGIVLFWLLVGFVSLVWTPYPPNATEFVQHSGPTAQNWLGTDHLGRDIMSRLMQGTQVILLKTRMPVFKPPGFSFLSGVSIPGGVAIWGVAGSLALGAFLGLNAGYRGGNWDQVIMQVLDALIAFPVIVLYLVVIAALGQGDLVVILAITVTGAPGVARLARSLALDIKTRDYIRAAETRGESSWYIMFREILPNARGTRCWWMPCCALATPFLPSVRSAFWALVCPRPNRIGVTWSMKPAATFSPIRWPSSGRPWLSPRWSSASTCSPTACAKS